MERRRKRKEGRKQLRREGFRVWYLLRKKEFARILPRNIHLWKDDRFWLVNKVEMLLIRERALREDTSSITVKKSPCNVEEQHSHLWKEMTRQPCRLHVNWIYYSLFEWKGLWRSKQVHPCIYHSYVPEKPLRTIPKHCHKCLIWSLFSYVDSQSSPDHLLPLILLLLHINQQMHL